MIVLPDADIDMAADAAVSAGYGSAGERCMAIATVVAVGDVADPLVEAIKDRLPKVKVGPGSDPTAEMGPLVTQQHRDKVASYLDSSAEQGATVVADGREHPLYDESDGFFLGVSLIDHVTTGMDAYRDEIFGPVLTVVRVDDLRRGGPARQRQPVRQRHGDLHPRRRRRPPVPVRGPGRHGRHQRADPGAGRLLQLRWLEALPVRRPAHVRPGGHPVLHAGQDRHVALAGPGHVQGRPRLPAHALRRLRSRRTRSRVRVRAHVLREGSMGLIAWIVHRRDRRVPRQLHHPRRLRHDRSIDRVGIIGAVIAGWVSNYHAVARTDAFELDFVSIVMSTFFAFIVVVFARRSSSGRSGGDA